MYHYKTTILLLRRPGGRLYDVPKLSLFFNVGPKSRKVWNTQRCRQCCRLWRTARERKRQTWRVRDVGVYCMLKHNNWLKKINIIKFLLRKSDFQQPGATDKLAFRRQGTQRWKPRTDGKRDSRPPKTQASFVFFFFCKSFAGIPRNFCGRIL